uniref:Store-operated calcium entry-associated regulatory factor n=1 Tax=Romanomermis culicivorax TaxID=13658 RepID=A0A915L0F8_ROMCU
MIYLLLLLCSFRYCLSDYKNSKVRLDKVQVLTLYKDRYTTGRRSAPLEYTIEQTSHGGNHGSYNYKPLKKSSALSDFIFWIIILLLLFLLYRIFIVPASSAGPRTPGGSFYGGGGGPGGGGGSPPGPGFRPDYYADDCKC